MDKNKIKKSYNDKIQNLVKLNKHYYDLSKPLVNDDEYDQLKADILSLEKKYDFLDSNNSPSKIVGFKPSKTFKKVLHRVPMLSLSNAFDEEDLVNFEKINNFLDQKNSNELEYSAEPKIDGISASLIYKKGKFVIGLSRGDGKEGEDITQNLMTINDIPKNISIKNFPDEIEIRGEVFIQNKDFEKSLKHKFANPRNAASGSLRQKNPKDTKKIPLKFIAYTFGYVDNLEIENQSDYLQQLKKWGFKINPFNKRIKGIKNLMKNYQEIEKKETILILILMVLFIK